MLLDHIDIYCGLWVLEPVSWYNCKVKYSNPTKILTQNTNSGRSSIFFACEENQWNFKIIYIMYVICFALRQPWQLCTSFLNLKILNDTLGSSIGQRDSKRKSFRRRRSIICFLIPTPNMWRVLLKCCVLHYFWILSSKFAFWSTIALIEYYGLGKHIFLTLSMDGLDSIHIATS